MDARSTTTVVEMPQRQPKIMVEDGDDDDDDDLDVEVPEEPGCCQWLTELFARKRNCLLAFLLLLFTIKEVWDFAVHLKSYIAGGSVASNHEQWTRTRDDGTLQCFCPADYLVCG